MSALKVLIVDSHKVMDISSEYWCSHCLAVWLLSLCVFYCVYRHDYPRNAYSLLLVMFNFYQHLQENHDQPKAVFVRHFFMPMLSLIIGIVTQTIFIGFLYVSSSPLCVCINTNLINPVLAWAALIFFVVVVYLDIMESFQMMEFQLLRNTQSHVATGLSFGAHMFASVCLVRVGTCEGYLLHSSFTAIASGVRFLYRVMSALFVFFWVPSRICGTRMSSSHSDWDRFDVRSVFSFDDT